MPTLTLTTDFGLTDGFVGTLKGVIWSICPSAQIADISHLIPPQNVLAGAFALWRAYPFFPPGTVHMAVVDPGVGTLRRPIAAYIGSYYFIGPDNGLFTPMYEDAEKNDWPLEVIHLTNPDYFLPHVSRTFHGRDIFAQVAAHLASGVFLSDLGPPITDPIRLSMPRPEKTSTGWRAHITGIDIFGNLTTDLPAAVLSDSANVIFHLQGREIRGVVASYGHRGPGELVALVDSENYLELAIVNGSAAQVTGAQVGDVVDVGY
jgi:S-adenosyl-L-methionine hydrolase (adenosine-forming)